MTIDYDIAPKTAQLSERSPAGPFGPRNSIQPAGQMNNLRYCAGHQSRTASVRGPAAAGNVLDMGAERASVQSPDRSAARRAEKIILTADLARAARALAQVSVTCVADHAGLSPERLAAFERHRVDLETADKLQLRRTLEKFGVVFISEDDEAGYGVRRRFTRAKVARLETWENEGGPAYEDDI
jgi:hypothetical protein